MRHLLTLTLLLALGCDFATGNDATTYLEPAHIKGSWLRIVEKPSVVVGLYEKDTTVYRIGVDSMPDVGTVYRKDPFTFYVSYEQGGSYGYIYDPEEDYDWDEEVSILRYILVEGLPGPTTQSTVKFSMPMTDSLNITLGGETFGTRRER